MFTYSPVMGYQEAVDFLAKRILNSQENPYIATIEGIPGIGKTHFCRDVHGVIGFNKNGATITKPHYLEREIKAGREFYLVEIGIYNCYELVEINIERALGKKPDFKVLMVSDISVHLGTPEISLAELMKVFQLVVENPHILRE